MAARLPVVVVDGVLYQLPPGDTLELPDSSGSLRREVLAIASNQFVFTLLAPPQPSDKTELYLNGIKAIYGVHFLVDGVLLEWLSPVLLEESDRLEVLYPATS